jgi:hypothetical protein
MRAEVKESVELTISALPHWVLNASYETKFTFLRLFNVWGQHGQYSNYATSWVVWGSNPGKGYRFLSSPKCPDRLCLSPSNLFTGYWRSFPGLMWLGRDANH